MLRVLFIPSCQEVHADLTEFLEGALPWHRRLGMRLHLMICRACRALRRGLEALPRLSKRALEAPAQAPQEARAALAEALNRIRTAGSPQP